MLEGKMPVMMASTASSNSSANGAQLVNGEVVYQDKIVYKELDNKENKHLEEELKNKDNMLRSEQEEKRLLRQKLEMLEQNF